MINRSKTYENIKKNFGLKSLSQSQVEGFEAIFNEWDERGLENPHYLAYVLATIWHEVNKTMQPIEEYGKGKGLKYGKRVWYDGRIYTDVTHIYYGRGLTQNTWRDIYEKLTKANTRGWDFVNNPGLLLKMEPSIWATFHAMTTGLYTGRKLSQYFNDKVIDPTGARSIINGKRKGELLPDKAELIKGYYDKFLKSIV
ncbi:hypothetical protein D3C86_1247010 [compost metagenome]